MKIESAIIIDFINNLPINLQSPLDDIICKMLEESKYIDGSSIICDESNSNWNKEHYHNWDCNPEIITDLNSQNFELEYNEENDIQLTNFINNSNNNPNIECVKGDIQLGKRVHALILSWFSINIYERPVIYLFRPFNIDKEQLQDDNDGTQPWNFNMKFIKKEFDKNILNGYSEKKYHDYRLPSLTDIKNKKIANNLSNKDFVSNPNRIYMALMNPTDLETLNKKFYNYIIKNCEKINITLIIDESDLMSPTASNNDKNLKREVKTTTKTEKLLSRLVSKVAHTIHITGTAHQFFWNFTTALSGDTSVHIPVEKVFVMKRKENYYGFMNNKVIYSSDIQELPKIQKWWKSGKGISSEHKYEINTDYNKNIKKIIEIITKRNNNYNSFLISEEKIQACQINLAEKIINDFSSLFVIVFHGKKGINGLPTGLRLYFPKEIDNLDIETEIQQVAINDTRLDNEGGVKGSPSSDLHKEYYEHYKYYDIKMKNKEFNIKMIYKILSMLFKKLKSNKTIITITGKYGERGYSFTSDDYHNNILHLTDQYFVSHASLNVTDIFQRGRIQGKYTDNPHLIFWTTGCLVSNINQYVEYITKIENKIMSLPRGHKHIRSLCESFLLLPDFVKTLGRPKHRRNLETAKVSYDAYKNSLIYAFPPDLDIEEYEEHFTKWCKEQNIEFEGFINKIEIMDKQEYINNYGTPNYTFKEDTKIFSYEEYTNYVTDKKLHKKKLDTDNFIETSIAKGKKVYSLAEIENELKNIKEGSNLGVSYKKLVNVGKTFTRIYPCYKDKNNILSLKIKMRICKILESKLVLPKNNINILEKQNYIEKNNIIIHSTLKYNHINDKYLQYNLDKCDICDSECDCPFDIEKKDIKIINDKKYFFLTSDGYVYYHDKDKSINKVKIKLITNDNSIILFKNECTRDITCSEKSTRTGIHKILKNYNLWAEDNNYEIYYQLKQFINDFEEYTGLKKSKSKGSGGYKIILKEYK